MNKAREEGGKKEKKQQEKKKRGEKQTSHPIECETRTQQKYHLQILLRRTCPSTFVHHICGYKYNLENDHKGYPQTNPRGVCR